MVASTSAAAHSRLHERRRQDSNAQQGRDVARSANAESEAVAAQAESQQREYLRLLDENAQLRRQLEDYELMFSGAQKKQI